MNLACPSCETVYRIDPARVPEGGARARCRECGELFQVEPLAGQRPGEVETAMAVTAAEARSEGVAPAPGAGASRPAAPVFGPQDPDVRARRLARALVSDIVVYNPEKLERSRETGNLRKEFRDDILKSWEEYVEQVGEEMAKTQPYFRDALNDILAEGERVF